MEIGDVTETEEMQMNLGDTIQNGIPQDQLPGIVAAAIAASRHNETQKSGFMEKAVPLLLAGAMGAGGFGLASMFMPRPQAPTPVVQPATNLTAPKATLQINQQPPAFRLQGSTIVQPGNETAPAASPQGDPFLPKSLESLKDGARSVIEPAEDTNSNPQPQLNGPQ